jgi:hypothetical protein
MCKQFDETVQHQAACCLASDKEDFMKYQDRFRTQLHVSICWQAGVKIEKEEISQAKSIYCILASCYILIL